MSGEIKRLSKTLKFSPLRSCGAKNFKKNPWTEKVLLIIGTHFFHVEQVFLIFKLFS